MGVLIQVSISLLPFLNFSAYGVMCREIDKVSMFWCAISLEVVSGVDPCG